MPGSVSFLGLGSSQLNADLIDQLREADEGVLLKPLERNAEKNIDQRTKFTDLSEKMKELKTASNFFSEDLTYLRRDVSVSGSGADVTTVDGVSPQKVSLHVNTLASNHIVESKGYDAEDAFLGIEKDETLIISLGDDEVEVSVTPFTRISDLKDNINDKLFGKVTASVLDTGGENGFKLILKTIDSGEDSELTFSVKSDENKTDKTDNGSSDNNDVKDRESTSSIGELFGFTTVSEPSDASFTFNGINIQRGSNKVDDLINGVTITLSNEDSDANFEIKQDLSTISERFGEFIEVLNETTTLLDDLTKYDIETSTAATFQGESRVVSIRSQITRVLLEILPDGSSLVDYGLDTNKEGEFTFNSDKFEELINQGGPEVEAFLNGKTKVEEAQLISSTIGYSSSEVNEINEDGSISTSTSKKPLSTDITINAGALVINDIRIGEIQLKAENTPAQNTQIVLEAINAKESETGVRAKLTGDNDQIMLINESGAEIDLVASSEAESFLGFKTSSEIGSSEYVPGIFSNLEEVFEELLVGEFSQLGLLESSLKSTTTKLDEERLNIIARLDSKYQIMEDQFAQYNVIINRFTTQFDALKQQIEFATANN